MVEDDNFFLTTVLPAGIRRTLEPTELDEITTAADQVDIRGDRYPAHLQKRINR
jgi:hypothetical protein